MSALAQLLSALQDVQTIRYCQLSASMIILYDHLITLDQEIRLVWRASWSIGKVVFLINRYYALMTVIFNTYALFSPHITDSVSISWYRWQGWTGVIAFVLAEMILQLRLYALYFLNKKVLAFITTMCLCSAASSAAVMGYVLSQVSASANAIPGTKFCVAQSIPHGFFAFWIPMLVSECVLCMLAIWRGLGEGFASGTFFSTGRRLVEVLVRDSLFYFVIMFATYLINTIVFIVGTENEIEIPIGFAVALSSVMGSRLCLNVRGMVSEEDLDATTLSALSVREPLNFASRARGAAVVDLAARSGWELTDIELDELRSMRAETMKRG